MVNGNVWWQCSLLVQTEGWEGGFGWILLVKEVCLISHRHGNIIVVAQVDDINLTQTLAVLAPQCGTAVLLEPSINHPSTNHCAQTSLI